EARWMTAVLPCGAGAILSRHSAAAWHGLPVSDNGLTRVTVTSDLRRPRIDAHRAELAPQDRSIRHHIPVASVARTLADLAHTLDDKSLHRVVKDAQFRTLFNEDSVRDALGRRPSRRLYAYLGDTTLTQSELEDRFLRLCRRYRIPSPETQYGTNPRVDFIWHDQRLIVEVDGWEAAHDVTARHDDVARQVLYAGNWSSTQSGPSSARR
ncbi:MAG: hypothetical protein QOG77_198, partial [Solirubrobacteraceae bacterium]|nr:hypothetical protein [Solirubrobacteraceae bacterium]